MKKTWILAILLIVASACAMAQEKKSGKHRYTSELKAHKKSILIDPSQEDLKDGMTVIVLRRDKRTAIDKALLESGFCEELDNGMVRITDQQGQTYDRSLFKNDAMLSGMEANYASLSRCRAGKIYVMAWLDNGKREWFWRDQLMVTDEVTGEERPEKMMTFSVGEYYGIPSMTNVKVWYQAEGCLNPAAMVSGYTQYAGGYQKPAPPIVTVNPNPCGVKLKVTPENPQYGETIIASWVLEGDCKKGVSLLAHDLKNEVPVTFFDEDVAHIGPIYSRTVIKVTGHTRDGVKVYDIAIVVPLEQQDKLASPIYPANPFPEKPRKKKRHLGVKIAAIVVDAVVTGVIVKNQKFGSTNGAPPNNGNGSGAGNPWATQVIW